MVRLCSVQGDALDSTSFLKVDIRNKQLTLCEPAAPSPPAHTGSAAGQARDPPYRRTSAPVPKTFVFDGVFSQDASQVSHFVSSEEHERV